MIGFSRRMKLSMPVVFDAVLLAVLALPLPFSYRILPVDPTPYWLFSIIYILVFGNIVFSLLASQINKKLFEKVQTAVVCIVIMLTVGAALVTSIINRGKNAPGGPNEVHDIILQLESGIGFLAQGKNPYYETYFQTPLAQWEYRELGNIAVNPALYNFVMPPWYLISSYPIWTLSHRTLGYFDGREILVFTFIGTLIVLWKWTNNKRIARLGIILFTFAPGAVNFFIEGRSDSFALFWFLLALYFLEKKRLLVSAALFGLALVSKQTIWFAAPFYLGYIWFSNKRPGLPMLKVLIAIGIVAGGILLPFLLWDAGAYVRSTVFYLSGNSPHSYPVSGYGLGMVLYGFGIIRDIHAYYPFVLWQAALGIPTALWACWYIRQKPSIHRLLFGYSFFLLIIWYTSRYFNNSHVLFLSTLFLLGGVKAWDEGEI